MNWFQQALADLPSADETARAAVRARASQVLRPLGALRRLDEIAEHIAGWHASSTPTVDRPTVVVFAADHGIAGAGVSAYPGDVTAHMLEAVRTGRATINAMATSVGAVLGVHDVGVGRPTGDIRFESAMTIARMDEIAERAAEVVDDAVAGGADLLVVGELGIGNTTVAAAIAAAMLGGEATDWVGRGTGVDDDGLRRKCDAVTAAVRRVGGDPDPLAVLADLGGSEFVAMAAAVARARHLRVPVVLDGYVATAAVVPMALSRPDALDHCIVGHASEEPGHRRILDRLGMVPLLDLSMRLGEGSGALAAVPLVRMACACVTDVATFAEWFGESPPEHS
jgi:nicotinate-nucleotide--dimethylbenzimidazole phosphoribosyltransferase